MRRWSRRPSASTCRHRRRPFAIPYDVIQGRHDLFAPTALAEAYFAKVTAPRKQLVVIEDAGHFALATHARQVAALLQKLLATN